MLSAMKKDINTTQVLFITNDIGQKTHAIVPIEIYQDLMALKDMIGHTAPITDKEIYTLGIRELTARGYPSGSRVKPSFVIIRDSQAVLETVESLPEHIREYRENLLGEEKLKLDPEHNCFVFTQDLTLPSASFAAALVSGNVRNGLDAWVNREGFSLKESGYGVKRKKRPTRG